MSLSNKRCAVLGAGGFIGTNLCNRLSGRVGHLRGFGRSRQFPDALSNVEWMTGDFNNPSDLALAVEGCDTVYHLVNASTPSSANADTISDAQNNIISTLRLFEICRNERVSRIIFVSSGGTIYGQVKEPPTSEDEQNWPITAYGISKLAVEKYLHLYKHLYNVDYRILRVSNPYGPYQTGAKNQGVIAVFLQKILSNQPIEIWGDGSIERDYLYIDDLIDALLLATVDTGSEHVFNIGSGTSHSLRNIVSCISQYFENEIEVQFLNKRSVDVSISRLCIDRANKYLKWKPNISLNDGVGRTVTWMEDYVNATSQAKA